MRFLLLSFVGALLAAASLVSTGSAQEYVGTRDFLTDYEIEMIRAAQEPTKRLEAYLHIASLRIELVRQLMAKEESGRGAKIHRNLKEYGKVIEAIDAVIDDALLDEVDVSLAIEPLVVKENEFLIALRAQRELEPEDLWRYEFVLEDAIEITSDSIEISGESLGERKRELAAEEAAEKAGREKTMTASRSAEVKKAKQAVQQKEETFDKKRPTLLKPGEKLGSEKSP